MSLDMGLVFGVLEVESDSESESLGVESELLDIESTVLLRFNFIRNMQTNKIVAEHTYILFCQEDTGSPQMCFRLHKSL